MLLCRINIGDLDNLLVMFAWENQIRTLKSWNKSLANDFFLNLFSRVRFKPTSK